MNIGTSNGVGINNPGSTLQDYFNRPFVVEDDGKKYAVVISNKKDVKLSDNDIQILQKQYPENKDTNKNGNVFSSFSNLFTPKPKALPVSSLPLPSPQTQQAASSDEPMALTRPPSPVVSRQPRNRTNNKRRLLVSGEGGVPDGGLGAAAGAAGAFSGLFGGNPSNNQSRKPSNRETRKRK
jgi:hypothetical protein